MDFTFSEDQKMLQAMLRDFGKNELEPAAAKIDETGEYPAEYVAKLADLGLMGLTIPDELGGSGKGMTEFCIAVEELFQYASSVAEVFRVSLSLAITPIKMYGSPEQKQKYVLPHAKGDLIACFGLTETGAGSDVASLQTTAVRKGDGYVINGNKQFITLGAEAGVAVVFATLDKSLRHKGITAFIVERNTPGFSVGKLEKKLGMHGVSATELIFDNCFIPEKNRLGQEGQGFKIALEALDESRVTVAAEAVGIARAAFNAALNYAKERQQFGQPIINFQAIQWMLSDMATQIEAARLLTYQAAYLQDRGLPFAKEAAMAKVYASEMANFVTNKAMQIHGGYGYTRDYPLERFLRDARITEIYEGTSEMMRMTIARQLMRGG